MGDRSSLHGDGRGTLILTRNYRKNVAYPGVHPFVAQRLIRHKSLAMTERYTHTTEDVARQAANAVPFRRNASGEALGVPPDRASSSPLRLNGRAFSPRLSYFSCISSLALVGICRRCFPRIAWQGGFEMPTPPFGPRVSAAATGRNVALVVLLAASLMVPGAVWAASYYRLFVVSDPQPYYTLGDEDEVFLNCYYGDDGFGRPTGVSSVSLQEATDCGEGGDGCVGRMHECDCEMELYTATCN